MAAEELGPSARISAVETFFRRLVSEGEQILNDLSEAATKTGDASIARAAESANAMPGTEHSEAPSSLQSVHADRKSVV